MENRIVRLEDFADTTKERLVRIEERLIRIDMRLDGVEARMATKEDLGKLEARMLKWYIATTITMVSLAFAAAKLIH